MKKPEQDSQKKTKIFTELPDVLIQESKGAIQYFIPAIKLKKFHTTEKSWRHIGPDTVTFVIPDPNRVFELPPFIRIATKTPSVLIQWPTGSKSYFVPAPSMRRFRLTKTKKHKEYGISFILPIGLEQIRELPSVMRAMLQSGESVMTPIP